MLRGRMEELPLMQPVKKATHVLRATVALALASTFIWDHWFEKGTIGYQAVTRNGTIQVTASSTPSAIFLPVLWISFFCVLMTVRVRIGAFQASSIQRRLAAFLVDLWIVMFSVIGTLSFIPLLLEARRTGTFQWNYARDYYTGSDGIMFALILVGLGLVVLYFVMPLATRRQTIGSLIFGLATVDAGGNVLHLPMSTALWRAYMEFRGLCSPIRTIKERDSQGRTWYDRETGFMVVRY
jgi:hypothetical protein